MAVKLTAVKVVPMKVRSAPFPKIRGFNVGAKVRVK